LLGKRLVFVVVVAMVAMVALVVGVNRGIFLKITIS